jgi:hypothetical protein
MGRRKRRRGKKPPEERRPHRLELDLIELELAKGHDGLLRGLPEPVIAAGAYLLIEGEARLIGRHIWRFDAPAAIPGKARATTANLLVPRPRLATCEMVLLMFAVEEDSGRGVANTYAALERGDDLLVLDDLGDHLHALHELGAIEAPAGRLHRALPRVDGRGFDELCVGDDWIDAAWMHIPLGPYSADLRFHARASDGKNDWTALLELESR